ncbi:NUDIX hydrolase [Lichenibacterium dinghuense]|uniref:NUDIX hydrolase n=1 Tax=Lichenibacterium dinghuense TaxID=2895977 RepID=UPI001F186214|nr:hypothetical protein [Lichenibacterium sp. 6Y81]
MSGARAVGAELIAVLVAVTAGTPRVLTIEDGRALPSGPFALEHRSLQSGLRAWVEEQTHHPLGYVEQLYTFADRDRGGEEERRISVSYLGLTRELPATVEGGEAGWRDWYGRFPWEDHRAGPPPAIPEVIAPALAAWAEAAPDGALRAARRARAAGTFGLDGRPWNEELVLQRYELLYEAGLVPEAGGGVAPGAPMLSDHRRILATAMARLRAKIKYRPVVFELMPPSFTLFQLQRSVEGIAGRPVHKGNFRRLIESQDFVEETGEIAADTGGRPARLVRFRGDVVDERAVAGSKLPLARS